MSSKEREMAYILAKEDRLDRFQALMSLIDPNVSSIVDVGCGIGSLASLLAERFPSASIAGLDRSKYLLNELRDKRLKPNIMMVQGEAPLFPLRPCSFDLAIAVQLLHEVFHFKGRQELVQTLKNVYDLLRREGEFIVLDHRNPGNALISVCLPNELLDKLRLFRLRFQPRRINYRILRKNWVRMSMRDFYDFVTKIWAIGTGLEEEEMQETHTPFMEQELANLGRKAEFKVASMMNLTPVDSYLKHFKIEVKTNLTLPNRHMILVLKK